MVKMEGYTALYVYIDINQNQQVGDVRASLLRIFPVKSRYGDRTCVTYEQQHLFPLRRSNIETVEITGVTQVRWCHLKAKSQS